MSEVNIPEQPYANHSMTEHLGIVFLPATAPTIYAEMPVDHRTCQPYGFLNGGASLALAEICAGRGSINLCSEGSFPCGMQVSGNHLAPVPAGQKVYATATLIHQGKTTHIWNIDIKNEQETLISTVRIVNYIVSRS
ncbi:MAG: PaaI family thioesterase [Phocaeicola sp.]